MWNWNNYGDEEFITQEYKDMLKSTSFEEDLRIAPVLYVDGYSLDELEKQASGIDAAQRGTVDKAIAILRANKEAGVDPMKFSRELMTKYAFTPEQWSFVIK